jgi:hypothetical protein
VRCGEQKKTKNHYRKEKTTMFEHLKRRAEQAQNDFERAYAQLFRDTAQQEKRYSDKEHRECLHTLDQERAHKLDAVIEELHREVSVAEKDLAVLEDGDPTALVSSTELSTAAAKKPFVDDEVWALPEGGLTGKLRAVLDGGDKASIFAYWRTGSARLQAILEALSASTGVTGGTAEVLGPQDLREVLDEMRRYLAGPERLAKAEKARQKTKGAVEVELLASNLKVGARSAAEAWGKRELESWGRVGML